MLKKAPYITTTYEIEEHDGYMLQAVDKGYFVDFWIQHKGDHVWVNICGLDKKTYSLEEMLAVIEKDIDKYIRFYRA